MQELEEKRKKAKTSSEKSSIKQAITSLKEQVMDEVINSNLALKLEICRDSKRVYLVSKFLSVMQGIAIVDEKGATGTDYKQTRDFGINLHIAEAHLLTDEDLNQWRGRVCRSSDNKSIIFEYIDRYTLDTDLNSFLGVRLGECKDKSEDEIASLYENNIRLKTYKNILEANKKALELQLLKKYLLGTIKLEEELYLSSVIRSLSKTSEGLLSAFSEKMRDNNIIIPIKDSIEELSEDEKKNRDEIDFLSELLKNDVVNNSASGHVDNEMADKPYNGVEQIVKSYKDVADELEEIVSKVRKRFGEGSTAYKKLKAKLDVVKKKSEDEEKIKEEFGDESLINSITLKDVRDDEINLMKQTVRTIQKKNRTRKTDEDLKLKEVDNAGYVVYRAKNAVSGYLEAKNLSETLKEKGLDSKYAVINQNDGNYVLFSKKDLLYNKIVSSSEKGIGTKIKNFFRGFFRIFKVVILGILTGLTLGLVKPIKKALVQSTFFGKNRFRKILAYELGIEENTSNIDKLENLISNENLLGENNNIIESEVNRILLNKNIKDDETRQNIINNILSYARERVKNEREKRGKLLKSTLSNQGKILGFLALLSRPLLRVVSFLAEKITKNKNNSLSVRLDTFVRGGIRSEEGKDEFFELLNNEENLKELKAQYDLGKWADRNVTFPEFLRLFKEALKIQAEQEIKELYGDGIIDGIAELFSSISGLDSIDTKEFDNMLDSLNIYFRLSSSGNGKGANPPDETYLNIYKNIITFFDKRDYSRFTEISKKENLSYENIEKGSLSGNINNYLQKKFAEKVKEFIEEYKLRLNLGIFDIYVSALLKKIFKAFMLIFQVASKVLIFVFGNIIGIVIFELVHEALSILKKEFTEDYTDQDVKKVAGSVITFIDIMTGLYNGLQSAFDIFGKNIYMPSITPSTYLKDEIIKVMPEGEAKHILTKQMFLWRMKEKKQEKSLMEDIIKQNILKDNPNISEDELNEKTKEILDILSSLDNSSNLRLSPENLLASKISNTGSLSLQQKENEKVVEYLEGENVVRITNTSYDEENKPLLATVEIYNKDGGLITVYDRTIEYFDDGTYKYTDTKKDNTTYENTGYSYKRTQILKDVDGKKLALEQHDQYNNDGKINKRIVYGEYETIAIEYIYEGNINGVDAITREIITKVKGETKEEFINYITYENKLDENGEIVAVNFIQKKMQYKIENGVETLISANPEVFYNFNNNKSF